MVFLDMTISGVINKEKSENRSLKPQKKSQNLLVQKKST